MLLSALIMFLLAPLAVYSKLAFKSFKYEKGVAYTVIKAWPDAPASFAVNLTWGETTSYRLAVRIPAGESMNVQLKAGVPSESGPLDIAVPSDSPPQAGYRMKLVSDQPGSDETYATSKPFTVQEGDFDSLTTSTSATPTTSTSATPTILQSTVLNVVSYTADGAAGTALSAIEGVPTVSATSAASKQFTAMISMILLPFAGIYLVL
ncbi:hypothetical protein FRC03_001095 [Tulasnella sp. 419]|nr:hypothetical protein FRC03_001095 [Tulasnella sp. 419]